VVIWLLLAIVLYIGILFGIAWVSLHPFRTPLFTSPGALGAPQEEFELQSTDGVRLRCWWVPAQNSRTVAILCHGYVMNRSELSPLAFWLWQRGISCLLFDFRAHGHTRGGASTIGCREADDVEAAIAEARRLVPGAKTLLIGSSMGAAASAFAAARDQSVEGLILDSCYSQLVRASFGWWRFLGGKVLSVLLGPTVLLAGPLAKINPFRVDVAQALGTTECPVLLLHGRCDDLALPAEAERNLAAVGSRGELIWFDDCGHSEFRWIQPARYYEAVERFLLQQGFVSGKSESPLVNVAG
jgi:alpha-beta hydrolase superfamily lysophospholipase